MYKIIKNLYKFKIKKRRMEDGFEGRIGLGGKKFLVSGELLGDSHKGEMAVL